LPLLFGTRPLRNGRFFRCPEVLVMQCHFPVRFVLSLHLAFLFAPYGSGATQAQAASPVTVVVSSGRVFTGFVDEKTDEAKLWLRIETGRSHLLRPIQWDRVLKASVDSETVTPHEFKQRAQTLETASPTYDADIASPNDRSHTLPPPPEHVLPPRVIEVRPPARVRSIHVEAQIANWDGDVEVDGLIVRVYPLADDGQVAPAAGSLSAELTAPRKRPSSLAPTSRGVTRETIGRWSRKLEADAVGPTGAVYQLEFQALHPDFHTDLASHGILHVRLAVPGSGVFETTTTDIRIRPFSPIRDELQRTRGRRFFPQELTGYGQRSSGSR
jgi:hypothetical protein